MIDSNKYVSLWQKYRPVILQQMKQAVSDSVSYPLSKHEFEAIGKREKAGYAFNLESINGKLANNIDGTAVGRDLLKVLQSSKTATELMQLHNFKITLSNKFVLTIQVTP